MSDKGYSLEAGKFRAGTRLGVLKGRRMRLAPWLFLLPALIVFTLFKYYPIFQGLYMSLFNYSIVNPPGQFVGLQNYESALRNADFWAAVSNTIQLLVIGLILGFWGPIVLAILINEVKHFQTFFRLMYFIPALAPGIAFIILWKYIWQPDYGLANAILQYFGLPAQLWLNDANEAKWAMKLPGLWIVGGFNFLIFLAALQSIPEDLYEAAAVDGASFLQKVRHITLPGLRTVTAIVFILAVIGGLQEFDTPYVMTGGGPFGTTVTVGMYIFFAAFRDGNYGAGMAVATMLFIAILAITYFQLRVQRER